MTDERVPESFCISSLAKILKSQLTGKEHKSSSANAAERLTITYCIYSVAYSPAPFKLHELFSGGREKLSHEKSHTELSFIYGNCEFKCYK